MTQKTGQKINLGLITLRRIFLSVLLILPQTIIPVGAQQDSGNYFTVNDSGIATAASTAAGNELFELEDDTTGAARGLLAIFNATPPGRHAVRLHTQLGQAFTAPRTLSVSLPAGPRYEVVADAPMVHPSGSFTWVGHLQGYGDHYRVLITTGQGRSFGRILTPDGEFLLESDESGTTWLIDTQAAGLTHGRLADDIALPPVTTPRPQPPRRQLAPRMAPEPTEDPEISDVVQPQAAAQSTIDLLLLYTAGMVNRYGGALINSWRSAIKPISATR